MTRKSYTSTDATYMERVKDMRRVLHQYRMVVGQRPVGDEYDRVLYQNLTQAINNIAKLTKDHTKYKKRPLTNQDPKSRHIRPRKGLIRRSNN